MKLLFLSDVEALRRWFPRLSSLQWILYKYGPYAFEIEDVLRQIAGRDIDELAGISALGRAYRVTAVGQLTSRLAPAPRSGLLSGQSWVDGVENPSKSS